MKCPNCGSEMEHLKNNLYQCQNIMCLSIMIKSHIEKANEVKKARLDKVLSTFTRLVCTILEYKINLLLSITYYNDSFYLSNPEGSTLISLETVESLLKDLEDKNDNE